MDVQLFAFRWNLQIGHNKEANIAPHISVHMLHGGMYTCIILIIITAERFLVMFRVTFVSFQDSNEAQTGTPCSAERGCCNSRRQQTNTANRVNTIRLIKKKAKKNPQKPQKCQVRYVRSAGTNRNSTQLTQRQTIYLLATVVSFVPKWQIWIKCWVWNTLFGLTAAI